MMAALREAAADHFVDLLSCRRRSFFRNFGASLRSRWQAWAV